MDISESPTQANDDRDYESARHYEPDPSSSHDEPHTLLEDETGAVNFGPLSDEAKAPSPVSDILSPVIVDITRRGSWRNHDSQNDESQADLGTTPGRPAAALPETPVAMVNPFKNKGQGSILRATQLFNATQMSAAKNFSPTSSRPSPNAFPQPFMSTSPAGLGTSPLKQRYSNGLSSPSVLRNTSTPTAPPTSLLEATPPPERRDDGIETIPESPPGDSDLPPPRKRRRQELLEEYEPVAVSQERKLFSDALTRTDSDGSDVDSQYRRRQRVKRIREDAERQLDEISFRLSRDEPKRVTPSPVHAPARPAASPRRRSEEPGPNAASPISLPSRIPQSSPPARPQRGRIAETTSSRALIPESPVAVPESDCAQGIAGDHVREATSGRATGTQKTSQRFGADDIPPTQPLSPSKPQPHSSPPPPTGLTRTSSPPVRSPKDGRAPSPITTRSPDSTLSPLTTTPSPVASPKTTTRTASPEPDCYDLPSSDAFELPPPRPSRRPVKTTYSRAVRKSRSRPGSLRGRDSPVLDTDSPDELATAPVRKPRRSRSARPSEPRSTLFENMAFAISFQEQKEDESAEDYAARCRASEELAHLVSRAGGRILSRGFTELLGNVGVDAKDSGVELLPEAEGLGFTALLADGPSRKVKYMQALALGLPCLAYQWATASLRKGSLQEWTSYLLSSGQSATLGGAALSRYLEPYPPGTASLADVVAKRKLLLGGSRILLVMKKARGGERGKEAYLLLARIVGARVSRVFSVREARKAIRKTGFEWIYVDEELGSAKQVLGEGEGRSKVRKGGELGVRCLSNELIIQSLIAGRVIDEGEREAHGL
ncbi:hypothetical protein VUR80DRAFT_7565 [Thermomyces stellatus]